MSTFKRLTVLILLGLISLEAKNLVLSFIPIASADNIKKSYAPLIEHVEREAGVKIDVKVSGDYTSVITGMQYKHIDIAYLGPKSYVEANKRAKAEPLAIDVPTGVGAPGYIGYILTKKGSGLKSLKDIKGKKWAFTDSQSASGTLVPTIEFGKMGIRPKEYFSHVIFSGSHQASILSVKLGKVDAASTNNLEFNKGVGKQWREDEFNIIFKSDVIPGQLFAVRGDLPEELKKKLKNAFVSFDDKEALKVLKLDRYAPGDDAMYDKIRNLIKLKDELKKKKG